MLKLLPASLACIHLLIASLLFGAAILAPNRAALGPVILYYIDYPCSIMFEWLRGNLHGNLGYVMRLIIDGAIYGVFGSCWFYFLGVVLKKGIVILSSHK